MSAHKEKQLHPKWKANWCKNCYLCTRRKRFVSIPILALKGYTGLSSFALFNIPKHCLLEGA